MTRNFVLYKVVFLIFFILFLNILSMKFFWYHRIWWWDMVMHFIGGVWVALALILVFFNFFIQKIKKEKPMYVIFIILSLVGLVAFGYELFEFSLQGIFSIKSIANPIDSVSDIFFGLAGAVTSIIYVFIKLQPTIFTNENILDTYEQ